MVVPRLLNDPTWSLCPWSIELELGEKHVEVPPLPAMEWLKYLLSDNPDLQGIVSEFMPEAEDYFLEQENGNLEDLFIFILDVIATVAGRPWWVTLRLISVAYNNWQIVGPLLTKNGVNAATASLASWLDSVLYITINNMDQNKVTMFSLQLEAPPPPDVLGVTTDSEVQHMDTMTVDRSSFLAMS